MSGLEEIEQWVKANNGDLFNLAEFTNHDEAFDFLNKFGNWRADLNDILLDDKSQFLDFLDTLITPSTQTEPPEAEPTGFIKIRAFSYIRNGKVVNVPSHQRRKRK